MLSYFQAATQNSPLQISWVGEHTFTAPLISRRACPVLPEGCKHRYGCNERDERRGITHSVNLPEHGEVACLMSKGDKKRELTMKVLKKRRYKCTSINN